MLLTALALATPCSARIVLVGVDGGSWPLLERGMAAGELPTSSLTSSSISDWPGEDLCVPDRSNIRPVVSGAARSIDKAAWFDCELVRTASGALCWVLVVACCPQEDV